MRETLIESGFVEKKDSPCDFYIINSCTVTHKADRDTRNLVHHFQKLNPDAKIAVAGCYAELKKDRALLKGIPGVTYLVRNKEKNKIASILKKGFSENKKHPSFIKNFEGRNRAFVKIQDGCNHKCSYCKVPIVRGPSKSRKTRDIIKEINALIQNNFKEIVLTGICLGSWGKDFKKKSSLTDLLKKIVKLPGNFKVRLSSIESLYITDSLIALLKKEKKICKHLHIPLQSGDDKVLKRMRRPYTKEKFFAIVKKIRKNIPRTAITIDVLLGFPGEDEKSFKNTLRVIKSIKPSRMHVFSYSKREGTKAEKEKEFTPSDVLKKRTRTLVDLSKKLSFDFAKRFIGKKEIVVIENERDRNTNLLTGYTDRYIKVLLEGSDELKNELCLVRIKGVFPKKGIILACLDNRQII